MFDFLPSKILAALQLDPGNSFVQANIQVAEQKWKEELQRAEAGQVDSALYSAQFYWFLILDESNLIV